MAVRHATGDVEIVFANGSKDIGKIGAGEARLVSRTLFDVLSSSALMTLADGTILTMDVGVATRRLDRPVVYLDQNHWIDLARVTLGSPRITGDHLSACERLINLARNREIILPLSTAHVVETAKKGDRQRAELAHVMLELSRGWQMRNPLQIRLEELAEVLLGGDADARAENVFTLEPHALWADRADAETLHIDESLPIEMQGLIRRISWAGAFAETLMDRDPTLSIPGLRMAEAWAMSLSDLAGELRTNKRARHYSRDVTRTRLISDIRMDLAEAAARAGWSQERFAEWLQSEAESAFSRMPFLSRLREVLHLRLINADDKWHNHDLNDMLYLCCASGYSGIVICEKKTCKYLARVGSKVPPGAKVFHRITEAISVVEEVALAS